LSNILPTQRAGKKGNDGKHGKGVVTITLWETGEKAIGKKTCGGGGAPQKETCWWGDKGSNNEKGEPITCPRITKS